jgi:nucleotide-binding universal stress UspA family protein
VMYGGSPVLVVRGGVRPRGPVLVAFDARHPARPVLAVAFHEAHLRGVEVHVLYGWSPADDEALSAGERRAARLLGAVLDRCTAALPQVKVVAEGQYTPDLPRTLVRASASAGLVVVGSHRRDDRTGVVLGPAAFALAHQAQCPVVVVHPDDRTAVDRP